MGYGFRAAVFAVAMGAGGMASASVIDSYRFEATPFVSEAGITLSDFAGGGLYFSDGIAPSIVLEFAFDGSDFSGDLTVADDPDIEATILAGRALDDQDFEFVVEDNDDGSVFRVLLDGTGEADEFGQYAATASIFREAAPIPLPASALLLGTAVGAIAMRRRRRS